MGREGEMGAGGSVQTGLSEGVRRHCASEFERLCPRDRDFLLLAEIRQLQSLQDWPVDMGHLSTIFVLDHDHNGRVTLQELLDFATICSVKADEFRHREFPMMIQGFCTLQMYDMTVALGPSTLCAGLLFYFRRAKQKRCSRSF